MQKHLYLGRGAGEGAQSAGGLGVMFCLGVCFLYFFFIFLLLCGDFVCRGVCVWFLFGWGFFVCFVLITDFVLRIATWKKPSFQELWLFPVCLFWNLCYETALLFWNTLIQCKTLEANYITMVLFTSQNPHIFLSHFTYNVSTAFGDNCNTWYLDFSLHIFIKKLYFYHYFLSVRTCLYFPYTSPYTEIGLELGEAV